MDGIAREIAAHPRIDPSRAAEFPSTEFLDAMKSSWDSKRNPSINIELEFFVWNIQNQLFASEEPGGTFILNFFQQHFINGWA